jgi:hypothetical protein
MPPSVGPARTLARTTFVPGRTTERSYARRGSPRQERRPPRPSQTRPRPERATGARTAPGSPPPARPAKERPTATSATKPERPESTLRHRSPSPPSPRERRQPRQKQQTVHTKPAPLPSERQGQSCASAAPYPSGSVNHVQAHEPRRGDRAPTLALLAGAQPTVSYLPGRSPNRRTPVPAKARIARIAIRPCRLDDEYHTSSDFWVGIRGAVIACWRQNLISPLGPPAR